MTYLSIIYCGKHNTAASLLQPAQNNALEIVFNLPVRFSTIVLYKNAAKTIIPIIGLYKQRHLMYVFKCITGIVSHTIQFFFFFIY